MHELRDGRSHVGLSEDLALLVFGDGRTELRARNPFQLLWEGGVVSDASGAEERRVVAGASEIRVELGGFRFPVRFPGNDYCRPDRGHVPDFRFTAVLSLADGDLVVRLSPVENLGENRLRILVGADFFTFSTLECASLALPVNYGVRLDFPRGDSCGETFQPGVAWSLPVHALFRAHGGIGLWCDDPDRCFPVAVNPGGSRTASAPCHQLYGPMANSPREMRFMLFRRGEDFRRAAERCRALRRASGRFRSLAEKAEEHPEVGRLPGTVFWKHNVYFRRRPAGVERTYSLYVNRPDWNENEGLPGNWTAAEVFETARARGFDRVTVCNTGWNRDGYDAGYPERLPPAPERGTAQEFQDAARAARALSEGYTLSVHDNYIDAYDDNAAAWHADEMLQEIPGVPFRSSVWRGGPTHWLCSEIGLRYARRDLPRIAALTGRGCIYLDVTAAIPLACCRSPRHPLTRLQDWRKKRELFALAKELFGALAVEGCGTDHFADLVDVGAYGAMFCPSLDSVPGGPVALPIPLWQMVYHDCVLNYFGEGYTPVHGSEYRLYQALLTLLPTSFDDRQKRLSLELRSAFAAPLLDFEDLVPRVAVRTLDGSYRTQGVSRSVYGDGTEVVANFDDAPFVYRGRAVPPREHLVLRAEA